MPEFSQNIYSAVKIGISPFDDRSDGNQSGDQFPVNKVVDWIGIYSMVIRKPPPLRRTKHLKEATANLSPVPDKPDVSLPAISKPGLLQYGLYVEKNMQIRDWPIPPPIV